MNVFAQLRPAKWIWFYLLAGVLFAPPGRGQVARERDARDFFPESRRTVLVVQSYHAGMRWTTHVNKGIASVFARYPEYDVRTEYLDTKRISSEDYFEAVFEAFRLKFTPGEVDLVVAVDDDALIFLRRYRDRLFGRVPVVFCGVNHFTPELIADFPLCTGVVEAFDLEATIDLALDLHPGTRRVYVINDGTVTGVANRQRIKEIVPRYAGRIEFVHLFDCTMEQLLVDVAGIAPDNLILLMSFNRDQAGRFFRYRDAAWLVEAEAPVPIYVIWDFYVGDGVVGGKVTSGISQGEAAALMGVRLLKGERVEDIPVLAESPNRYMFDFEQLARWEIPKKRLPPDSVLINTHSRYYAIGRETLWLVLGAVGLLLVLCVALALNLRARRKAQHELEMVNRLLRGEVDERKAVQQALQQERETAVRLAGEAEAARAASEKARQSLKFSLEEKTILFREVHHRVKNNLQIVSSLLNLQAHHITDPAAIEAFHETDNRLRSMSLLHETLYRTDNLAHLDFAGYVEAICTHLFRVFGPEASRVRLVRNMQYVALDLDQAVSCGIIINELLSNSLKYAFPGGREGEITISLSVTPAMQVELVVADNGSGLSGEPESRGEKTLGIQLVYMLAEKLMAVVENDCGEGTRYIFRFPLRRAAERSGRGESHEQSSTRLDRRG